MGQPGFFDLGERYRGLDAKKDPLVVLNAVVPWEDFRAGLSAVWRKPDEERKSAAGRKPWDEIVIFKTLVRFCQGSRQKVSPEWDEAHSGSCGLQDGQHRHSPPEKEESAAIGGNVLVVAGAEAEKVAQFVVGATEPGS